MIRSGLAGPNNCAQDSAVTCGGIISGSRKQNTSAALARISVRATISAKSVPRTSEIAVPSVAVTSECQAAVQVEPAVSTERILARSGVPPGAKASTRSRVTGRTLTRPTKTTRTARVMLSPFQRLAMEVMAGSGQPPKSSAKRFLFASSSASALAASKGISLIASRAGKPAGASTPSRAGR